MSARSAPGRAARLRLDRVLGATLAALVVPATLALAPQARAEDRQFRAPTGPMLLTREFRRALADGQVLVVRRRYLVRFAPTATGYTVSGEPAGVEVDAPAAMADLAEVERNRSDGGIFPLELDRFGQIVAGPAPAETVDTTRARTAMAAYLARTDLTAQERTAAQAIAIKLQGQSQAAGSGWPADLFHPAPGQRSEARELALPDGRNGRVTVTVEASGGANGLLARMERRVATELGGTQRINIDRWTLAEGR